MIKISGYQIVEQISESNYSIVYRGKDKTNNQPVILKLNKQEYQSAERFARISHEFEMIKSLQKDEIDLTYKLISHKKGLVLVMEDFGGQSLAKSFSSKQFNLNVFLNLALQITSALEKIHQKHIIHKDINPSNIVWNSEINQLNIIDFGIATLLNKETASVKNPKVLEGTLAYISPEQTGRMNRSLDYRTDFYSLGITLYELSTGHLPFDVAEPLEFVHAHIAKNPVAPCAKNHTIPESISKIIMKLMSKNAEYRYQSTFGLRKDLEYCLENSERLNDITDFVPGQFDFSSRFTIPQKLYGRNQEITSLLQAFERASRSNIEMMVIGGYSGVGKTSLIYDIQKPVVEKNGFFITGKFDQYKKNIPYSALFQAFQGLIRQILTESQEQILIHKQKLLESLGASGQVVVDVIPELELIIGKQADVADLPATEQQNRFNYVFQSFVKTFASISHPLTIFLDDLQWADLSSLKLLETFMNDIDAQNIFIIGAYRDNEVDSTHPLAFTLNEIKKSQGAYSELFLEPLNLENLNLLIADTIKANNDKGRELSRLVMDKTLGNPFFVNQLLNTFYIDGFIVCNTENGLWNFDIKKIRKADITENVVDLMLDRIYRLPEKAQHILKLASCIGNVFDLKTLSIVNEKSLEETGEELWEALNQGLVSPLDDFYKYVSKSPKGPHQEEIQQLIPTYSFLHDRIQQAAYSLIQDDSKKEYHIKIGNLLHKNTDENENAFEIANHLNEGIDIITDANARQKLSELNLRAGKKSRKSAAYQPSFEYLKKGISLLENDCWKSNYEHTLELYTQAAEAAYLNTDFEHMEQFGNEVLRFAKNILDKIKIYEIKLMACQAQSKLLDSVHIATEALQLLECDLPTAPTPEIMQNAFAQTASLLGDKSPMDLLELPPMTDPEKLAILRILESADTSFYQAAPPLFVLSALLQVRLSIEFGNAPQSACAYTMYAIILCGVINDIDTGYQYGNLALALLDRFEISRKTKVLMLFRCQIWHWKNPIQEGLNHLHSAFKIGKELGDMEYTAQIDINCSFFPFYCGNNLADIQKESIVFENDLKKTKQGIPLAYMNILQQVMIFLTNGASNFSTFDGDKYSEKEMFPSHVKNNDKAAFFSVYFSNMFLNYMFENYEEAAKNASLCAEHEDGLPGWVGIPPYVFYASLSYLALIREGQINNSKEIETADDNKWLAKISSNQERMKNWGEHAPMNYLHKYYIVEAEKLAILKEYEKAEEYYDKSIELAGEHNYTNDEAVANELAAKYYYRKGKLKIARMYMTDAFYCYEKWGAKSKIKSLQEKYDFLLNSGTERPFLEKETKSSTKSIELNSDTLDLTSVLKASQIISGEIVLDKLLRKMMIMLIENAGAQKGILMLQKDNKLFVEVEEDIESNLSEILQSIPLENKENISEAIVHYVVRTGEIVVLEDATKEGIFTQDAYVMNYSPKSILCSPLINQGKLIGVLYLENNLTSNAFTQDKLKVLNLLTAQIAISIENALLYDNLEKKVKDRTAKVVQQNEEIQSQAEALKASNAKLIELDEFKQGMTGMIVHDLKNPLNGIINIPLSYSFEKQVLRTKQIGKQLLNMVLNILDVHKYEETSMLVDKLDYSLLKLSQNAIDEVTFLADQKNISISNTIQAETGVKADSEIIERVFVNILTNAIKYTPNNGNITLQGFKTLEGFVKVEIEDKGQGIPQDQLSKVFGKFGQIAAKKSGKIRSTGLGLTFCKMAVEAHGGEIGVASDLNKGTTFWFTLYSSENIPLENREIKATPLTQNSTLTLTTDDKKILEPFVVQFKEYAIYDVSMLRKLLTQIEKVENEHIKIWKEEMSKAIRSGNEEKYRGLLNL